MANFLFTTVSPAQDTNITMEMNGATIIMKVGEKRKLQLPGNATTGYAWRIVNQEGNSIETNSKWHYKAEFPFLMGSGGYFQKELIAKELGVTVLYLIYDAVAEPQLGYSYFLQFNVQTL
jgi:predicted secreted protein